MAPSNGPVAAECNNEMKGAFSRGALHSFIRLLSVPDHYVGLLGIALVFELCKKTAPARPQPNLKSAAHLAVEARCGHFLAIMRAGGSYFPPGIRNR
jgi:hypothetical protein